MAIKKVNLIENQLPLTDIESGNDQVHLNTRPHINYALVEDTRPPMYTAMKYWGKKPHNIWAKFIERYCPPNGTILDPFAGSAIAGFEAVKNHRKAIVFDLNPLTTFIVKVFTANFNQAAFLDAFKQIISVVENDPVYIQHYTKTYQGRTGVIYNYRWLEGKIEKIALEIPSMQTEQTKKHKQGARHFLDVDNVDRINSQNMVNLEIPYWYPSDVFPDTPTITHRFIANAGGNGFQYLWTRRNLYLLARIFDEILKQFRLYT
jgi:hypothetical protein